MANIHWQDVFKVLIHLPKHAIRHIYLFIYLFLFFFVVTCSWPKAKVQVRDCRASLWTTSVRWVMSCCWAWCLMYSSVRTWSRDGWGWGWGDQYSCPVQADKSLEWWVCVCVWTHRHPGLAVPVLVAEVPQVDRQLAQFVAPQVPMSQQDTKQGKGQNTLTPYTLLQQQVIALHFRKQSHIVSITNWLILWRFLVFPFFVSPHLCRVPSGDPGSVRSRFHTAYWFPIET